MRLQVFIIRSILGLLFAFLLTRFFFPASGIVVTVVTAALLIFFAYVFEVIHSKDKRKD